MYSDKWYKVWYYVTLYDGSVVPTFEYAFGPDQVSRFVDRLGAFKVTEWIV